VMALVVAQDNHTSGQNAEHICSALKLITSSKTYQLCALEGTDISTEVREDNSHNTKNNQQASDSLTCSLIIATKVGSNINTSRYNYNTKTIEGNDDKKIYFEPIEYKNPSANHRLTKADCDSIIDSLERPRDHDPRVSFVRLLQNAGHRVHGIYSPCEANIKNFAPYPVSGSLNEKKENFDERLFQNVYYHCKILMEGADRSVDTY